MISAHLMIPYPVVHFILRNECIRDNEGGGVFSLDHLQYS